ncbi:MAG TPA: diacylglycerol kinase family protein [Symbiobacteriaceae bacterium]|nr:diacylglycerol kinase family protein [Symbiobacteriaceae bacterium]
MTFSRIAVIYNPNAGRSRERQQSVDRFAALLTEAGSTVDICPTQRPNHATDLARDAVARGCDLVVANGGDGTMNEVLQSVVGTDAALGFWPGGTANVLAAEIGFPSDVDQVVGRVMRGQVKRVTVGQANNRYFLLMAGIGLDAAVSAAVDPGLKRKLGKAAFGIAALKYIWNWNLQPVRVELPGEEVVGNFVVAGNAHSYGGGFQLTPSADLSDPELDICIFTSEKRFEYLKFALAAVAGWHRGMENVVYRKVRAAKIHSAADESPPVQLDGEVTGGLPLQLVAIPEGVKLLV